MHAAIRPASTSRACGPSARKTYRRSRPFGQRAHIDARGPSASKHIQTLAALRPASVGGAWQAIRPHAHARPCGLRVCRGLRGHPASAFTSRPFGQRADREYLAPPNSHPQRKKKKRASWWLLQASYRGGTLTTG